MNTYNHTKQQHYPPAPTPQSGSPRSSPRMYYTHRMSPVPPLGRLERLGSVSSFDTHTSVSSSAIGTPHTPDQSLNYQHTILHILDLTATTRRAKETEELTYTRAQLHDVIRKERDTVVKLAAELRSLRDQAANSVLLAEVDEEHRINCLMRRLSHCEKDEIGTSSTECAFHQRHVSKDDQNVPGVGIFTGQS